MDPVTPTANLFPTSNAQPNSPTTDSQQLLITLLQDQLHSVLGSNPIIENGGLGSKRKLGMLTGRLVCIVYLCSGFMLVFSKLIDKLILDIIDFLCMVIHDYMHIGYT
jgi:hypothetical protein